jgi:hypothetical protein
MISAARPDSLNMLHRKEMLITELETVILADFLYGYETQDEHRLCLRTGG